MSIVLAQLAGNRQSLETSPAVLKAPRSCSVTPPSGTYTRPRWSQDLTVTAAMELLPVLYSSQAGRPDLKVQLGYVLGMCCTAA